MKKLIAIAGMSALFVACQPEGDNSRSQATITDANAEVVLAASLAFSDPDIAIGLAGGDFDVRSPTRSLMKATQRNSGTFDCSGGGSVTFTFSGDIDSSTGDLEESGTINVSVESNNCVQDGMTQDGGMSMSFTWTGYSDYEFDTVTSRVTFDDFSASDSEGEVYVDGWMQIGLATDTYTFSWDITSSAPGLGGVISSKTTTDFTQGYNDWYPTQGAFRVDGADDSYLTATVVANGYEVSVNGGQATLYTWAEIDY